MPGDYPDPSIIRVGDTYWATATTSQWAPIFPLLTRRTWSTGGRARCSSAARMVGWQLLGARDCRGSRPVLHLLHRAQEGGTAVRGGRRAATAAGGRIPITGRWCVRRRGRSTPWRSPMRRAPLSRLEGGWQQPQAADAALGAAALRGWHEADWRAARDPPQRGVVGGAPDRRAVHPEARRLVLSVLFSRRLLRPPLQLQARRRAIARAARAVGA